MILSHFPFLFLNSFRLSEEEEEEEMKEDVKAKTRNINRIEAMHL